MTIPVIQLSLHVILLKRDCRQALRRIAFSNGSRHGAHNWRRLCPVFQYTSPRNDKILDISKDQA
jgi:hypothetical protein